MDQTLEVRPHFQELVNSSNDTNEATYIVVLETHTRLLLPKHYAKVNAIKFSENF